MNGSRLLSCVWGSTAQGFIPHNSREAVCHGQHCDCLRPHGLWQTKIRPKGWFPLRRCWRRIHRKCNKLKSSLGLRFGLKGKGTVCSVHLLEAMQAKLLPKWTFLWMNAVFVQPPSALTRIMGMVWTPWCPWVSFKWISENLGIILKQPFYHVTQSSVLMAW